MAITIPETMPEDWFGEVEAEMDRRNIADDPDRRFAMEEAYQEGLKAIAVRHIMGRLKDRCMEAAIMGRLKDRRMAATRPQEDASAKRPSSAGPF